MCTETGTKTHNALSGLLAGLLPLCFAFFVCVCVLLVDLTLSVCISVSERVCVCVWLRNWVAELFSLCLLLYSSKAKNFFFLALLHRGS